MNKEFMKKLIKAKVLEYEAIKEIIPSSIQNKINDFQKEAVSFLKDVAIEMLNEDVKVKEENKKSVKKIGVDFK